MASLELIREGDALERGLLFTVTIVLQLLLAGCFEVQNLAKGKPGRHRQQLGEAVWSSFAMYTSGRVCCFAEISDSSHRVISKHDERKISTL